MSDETITTLEDQSSVEAQLTPEARDGLNSIIAVASSCPETWILEEVSPEGQKSFQRIFVAEIDGSSSVVYASWLDKEDPNSLSRVRIENGDVGMAYELSLQESVLTRVVIDSWGGRSKSGSVQVYDSAESSNLLPYVSTYLAGASKIEADVDNLETQMTRHEIAQAGCSLREVPARAGDGVVATVTIASAEGSLGQLGRYELVDDASGAVLATIDVKTPSGHPAEHDVVMAAAAYVPYKPKETTSTIS